MPFRAGAHARTISNVGGLLARRRAIPSLTVDTAAIARVGFVERLNSAPSSRAVSPLSPMSVRTPNPSRCFARQAAVRVAGEAADFAAAVRRGRLELEDDELAAPLPRTPPRKKIGLLQIDYSYETNVGDIDNASTWNTEKYEIVSAKVEGLSFGGAKAGLNPDGTFSDNVFSQEDADRYELATPNFRRTRGTFEEFEKDGKTYYRYSGATIQRNYEAAVKKLEDAGCVAVTGNCGFLQQFQDFTSGATNLPVLMSSCLQLQLLAPLLANKLKKCKTQGKVIVLTANGKSFCENISRMLPPGVKEEQVLVVGCEDIEGFGLEVEQGQRHDPAIAGRKLQAALQEKIDIHGTAIKGIVSECTVLPHYTSRFRKTFGIPVYDIVSMVDTALFFLDSGKNDDVHYSPRYNMDESPIRSTVETPRFTGAQLMASQGSFDPMSIPKPILAQPEAAFSDLWSPRVTTDMMRAAMMFSGAQRTRSDSADAH